MAREGAVHFNLRRNELATRVYARAITRYNSRFPENRKAASRGEREQEHLASVN